MESEMFDSKVYAVQMVEYNPNVGNKRKTVVISGIMSFTAGNAVPETPFVPSQIVPIKNPHQLVKVGDREVELFDFLTGKDPEEPDKYFVHQPKKPAMPVFRRIVANDMAQLKNAVEEQAKRSAQVGRPIAPAPILGVQSTAQKTKAASAKTVEQILAETRASEPAQEETPAEPEKKAEELPTFMDIMDKVASKKTTGKAACAELDKIKDTLEADDLTYIAENGTKLLKDWAEQEMDERVAKGK